MISRAVIEVRRYKSLILHSVVGHIIMKRRTTDQDDDDDDDVDDHNTVKQQQHQQLVIDDIDIIDDNNNDTTTTTTSDDYNNTNNMFSKALLNLTFTDRNQIEEEIHGVSCMSIDETTTPKLIEESLVQFDLELELIPIENKIAYNKVVSIMQSSYLLSKETKLRFLRSELFDSQKSAVRYTKYINVLLDIYGDYALQRPIRLQDLERRGSEELSFLKSGQYQLLPYRDRGGRRILAIVSNSKNYVPRRVLLKVFLYLTFVCVGGCKNDTETQRKGIVVVVYFPLCLYPYNANTNTNTNTNENELENNGKKDTVNIAQWTKERMEAISLVCKVTPSRVAAIHICLPNSNKFKALASFYGIALKASNARTKLHLGNPIEIRYKLQQYGIPIDLIPSTDTGNIKLGNFKQWMKLRKNLEYQEQIQARTVNNDNNISTPPARDDSNVGKYDSEVVSTTNYIVECPLSNDVIFRRGKTMNYHLGNAKFQDLIESHIYEHSIDSDTSLLRRTEIEVDVFIEVVRGGGNSDSGRFLTWNVEKKWWMVMQSDDEIQKKIYNAFRDFRLKMLKVQQPQQKVQTRTKLNSFFEQQQNGQKKKRHNSNNNDKDGSDCSRSDCGDENNGCNACGYFFSTDDGSYVNLDDELSPR